MHSIGEWDKRYPFIVTGTAWAVCKAPSLDTQCYNKNENNTNSLIAPMPFASTISCKQNILDRHRQSVQPSNIPNTLKLEDDVFVLLGSQDIGRGIFRHIGRFWCYWCFGRLFALNVLTFRKG